MKTWILAFFFLAVFKSPETKVLICKSSASYAYHSHSCQGLKQCKAAIEKISVDEAKNMGRKPCGYCYTSNKGPVMSSPGGSSQCAATTKKGTRCSRSSRSGGYCWQHGG